MLLASEQRDVDAHKAAIDNLAMLASELEPRVPLDGSQRKMRFGSPHLPGASADYSALKRLSREHSTVDWLKAHGGGRGDYDPDQGWAAFCQGLVDDDWSAWKADFGPHMGATTLAIPRITGDPTAAWHAESATITPSDVTVDQVKFTAKPSPSS